MFVILIHMDVCLNNFILYFLNNVKMYKLTVSIIIIVSLGFLKRNMGITFPFFYHPAGSYPLVLSISIYQFLPDSFFRSFNFFLQLSYATNNYSLCPIALHVFCVSVIIFSWYHPLSITLYFPMFLILLLFLLSFTTFSSVPVLQLNTFCLTFFQILSFNFLYSK